MITKIAVRNFQSLAAVTLELGRITVITGHSDSGKSAFLRAVEAAVFNDSVFDSITHLEPQGDADKMTVALQSNENTVLWEKSKSSTTYKLLFPNQAPILFQKMGRGFVPEEIQKALGFRELQADKNIFYRLQFAKQHDSPFLIVDRGGVFASRILGRLTGVNILSYASKNAKHDKDQTNERLRREQESVAKLQQEFAGFVQIDAKKRHLLGCKRQYDLLQQQQVLNKSRSLLVGRWQQGQAIKQQLMQKPSNLKAVAAVELGLQRLWPRLGKLEQLQRLLQQSKQLQALLFGLKRVLASTHQAQIEVTSPYSLLKLVALKQLWIEKIQSLSIRKVNADGIKVKLNIAQQELSEFDSQFPLCPFQSQFKAQQGVYRCTDLMKSIKTNV